MRNLRKESELVDNHIFLRSGITSSHFSISCVQHKVATDWPIINFYGNGMGELKMAE